MLPQSMLIQHALISSMRRFCPSISDLHAFEVAARQGSFTRAAQELCVTQGAVSKQIKNLETFLGVTLFSRTRAGLMLTQAGHAYLNDVRAALNKIESASLAIMSHRGHGGTLNITCMPTLGAKWLIPRLPDLRKQRKNLETFLGVTLFSRTRAGLMLTQAGHAYLNDVRAALNKIESASLAIMSHRGHGGTLNITCMPTLGAKWLIPRLPDLRKQ